MSRLRTRRAVSGFIEPCQPTPAPSPPTGLEWPHEIKHDGYRMIARREAAGIRLITRNGHDWTDRFPSVVAAVRALPRVASCVIDGEVAVAGPDGITSFALLRSGSWVKPQAQLCAFDLIELDGVDLRREPLEQRKLMLARLLRRCRPGLSYTDHVFGDGLEIFAHACKMGLEGIVSKRKSSTYRSGRSLDWRKSKNPESAAVRA